MSHPTHISKKESDNPEHLRLLEDTLEKNEMKKGGY